MTILITGCAGFIGYSVAKELLKMGDTVIGVDNFNTSYRIDIKHQRNGRLGVYNKHIYSYQGSHNKYKCVFADTTNRSKMEQIFTGNNIKMVIHLAARAGVRESVSNPDEYVNSNIIGFYNIMECCRKYKVKKVIYASSSSVYGNNKKLPFSENDKIGTPLSIYAASKISNELMAHTYSHLHGIQTIGLRFFTVYGPWGRPDMAIWKFTHAIMKEKPIKVYNYGDMSRSFTYIDDIASAVRNIVLSSNLDQYEIINLGNNVGDTLGTLIGILEDKIGKSAIIEHIEMQPGDVKEILADIKKAKKKLNWMPCLDLDDGLERFVDWYKEYIYE